MIILPLPPATLSPNARVHWAKKAKSAKKYRQDCHLATLCWLEHNQADAPIEITLKFCFAQNRKRDDDNLIASFKSGRDGMADALGIDDSRIKIKAVEIVVDKARAGSVYVTVHSNQ